MQVGTVMVLQGKQGMCFKYKMVLIITGLILVELVKIKCHVVMIKVSRLSH
jgi:hypothetical protein